MFAFHYGISYIKVTAINTIFITQTFYIVWCTTAVVSELNRNIQ